MATPDAHWVDWRQLPEAVSCHHCGCMRGNRQHDPGIPHGYYVHPGDGLFWCTRCWQKWGFRKYYGEQRTWLEKARLFLTGTLPD